MWSLGHQFVSTVMLRFDKHLLIPIVSIILTIRVRSLSEEITRQQSSYNSIFLTGRKTISLCILDVCMYVKNKKLMLREKFNRQLALLRSWIYLILIFTTVYKIISIIYSTRTWISIHFIRGEIIAKICKKLRHFRQVFNNNLKLHTRKLVPCIRKKSQAPRIIEKGCRKK